MNVTDFIIQLKRFASASPENAKATVCIGNTDDAVFLEFIARDAKNTVFNDQNMIVSDTFLILRPDEKGPRFQMTEVKAN